MEEKQSKYQLPMGITLFAVVVINSMVPKNTIYDDVWRVITIIVLLTLLLLTAIEEKYNPFSIKGFPDVKKAKIHRGFLVLMLFVLASLFILPNLFTEEKVFVTGAILLILGGMVFVENKLVQEGQRKLSLFYAILAIIIGGFLLCFALKFKI